MTLAVIQTASAYAVPSEFKPKNAPTYSMDFSTKTSPDTVTNILLQTIAGALLMFAAPIAVISIVMAAFTITANGADSEKVAEGKKHLTWAIIGLIAIILSYATIRYVIDFTINVANYASDTTQAPAK